MKALDKSLLHELDVTHTRLSGKIAAADGYGERLVTLRVERLRELRAIIWRTIERERELSVKEQRKEAAAAKVADQAAAFARLVEESKKAVEGLGK